jgi:hypothetical protein
MKEWAAFRWGEAGVAAALIALGVYMIIAATGMPAGSVGEPGPAVFPFAIGASLVCVGGGIVAGIGVRAGDWTPIGREAAATIAAVLAASAAFERAGALVTFAVLLAVLYWTLARGAWWKGLIFGTAGAAAAWVLFVRLLGVGLPGPGF